MRVRVPVLLAAASAAALAFAPAWGAGGSGLTLHPSGFGPHSYAAWKAQQGEADSTGGSNQALYLQKEVPTLTNAAGIAVIDGVAGMDTGDLNPLAFDIRDDSHCGAGAPRFNVVFHMPGGPQQTIFVGCAAMTESAPMGGGSNWHRRTIAQPLPSGGVVDSLAIVFDEGNEFSNPYAYLDDIQVGSKVWTSAADNGNTSG